MFTWKEIIHIAMQIEQNGEQTYRHAAKNTEDPRMSQVLLQLADEELRHSRWLSRLTPTGSIPSGASDFEKLTRAFLRETVADRPFSLQEVDFTAIESLEALLETAIALEHDTIQFYEMIRRFAVNDEVSGLFDIIIAEEKCHLRTLKQTMAAVVTRGSRGGQ